MALKKMGLSSQIIFLKKLYQISIKNIRFWGQELPTKTDPVLRLMQHIRCVETWPCLVLFLLRYQKHTNSQFQLFKRYIL